MARDGGIKPGDLVRLHRNVFTTILYSTPHGTEEVGSIRSGDVGVVLDVERENQSLTRMRKHGARTVLKILAGRTVGWVDEQWFEVVG